MSAIKEQQPSFLERFNSLRWYDVFTSFIFRFMAKTSEPLLAAGVIISAIDFLQKGQLLANNPELSLWWSIAQGVAMEVSVGPVLVNALEANEENDPLKAKFYSMLSALLALVGGAMLLMQFGLSVGGLTEGEVSQWILWPLFVARTVASISYIALSCTKHKRFSGISPKVMISETNRAFADAMTQMQAMQHSTMQAMQHVTQRLTQIETNTMRELQGVRQSLMQEFTASQSSLDIRLEQMEQTTDHRLQVLYQGFVEEVSVVKVTLEEHTKVIKRIPERTVNEVSIPHQLQAAKLLTKETTKVSPNIEFDKKKFVIDCLTEHPDMGGADIQRKASELGQTISAGYISDLRKSFSERMTGEQVTVSTV